MNKKILKIVLITFVILIVFSSLIRTYSAINLDNIVKEDPETIRICQVDKKLDKICSFLIIILIIISILHIVKVKKERKIMIMIYSYFMACFPIAIKTSKNITGGLPGTERTPEENLILTIAGVVITILLIGTHIFFIRKNSKMDKDICQNNKNEGRIDIN